jgi:hypothetical protein
MAAIAKQAPAPIKKPKYRIKRSIASVARRRRALGFQVFAQLAPRALIFA